MKIELGNPKPHDATPDKPLPGPAVTTVDLPDEYTCAVGADVKDLALHLARNPGVTQLPDQEAFVNIIRMWDQGSHGQELPVWVACEGADPAKAAELQRLLSEFWGCASGKPADVEDTHYTESGPPGVGPIVATPEV